MATAMQSEANVPLLCAPAHITRYAGKFEKLSQNSWRVPAGDPVGHFLGYNGPAEIVGYDWDRARGVFVHPLLVQLRPTVLTRPDAKQQKLNCAVQRLGR
jgi:hypothetical protein